MAEDQSVEAVLIPERVGDRLRAARVRAKMDLADIANKTRIPLRHLTAIEAGAYDQLPTPTYCVGFVKAFARIVGENETELATQLKTEIGHRSGAERLLADPLDDSEPAALPTKRIIWTTVAIILVFILGYAVWRTLLMQPDSPAPAAAPAVADAPPANAPAVAAPVAATSGDVTLTALKPVWVRIYDADDKVLFEKEMTEGERYNVPADANQPQIRTGRADLIAVSVGGRVVAALGPGERTIKNVGVSAAALMARPAAPPTPLVAAPPR